MLQYTEREYYSDFDNNVPLWNATTTYFGADDDRAADIVRLPDGTQWRALDVDGQTNLNRTPQNTGTGLNPVSGGPNAALWEPFVLEDLGYYQYVTAANIVNSFMFAYAGMGMTLHGVPRATVEFFTQQAIQEFNYDIFQTKSFEYELTNGRLNFPLPQDLVSIARISTLDDYGNERVVQPRRDSSNPKSAAQLGDGDIRTDSRGNIIFNAPSVTQQRFNANQNFFNNFTQFNGYFGDSFFNDGGAYNTYGKRYYLQPEKANLNGSYVVNTEGPNKGTISFDNSLDGRIVTILYTSDGLETGNLNEVMVPKLAEKAVLQTVYYELLDKKDNPPARLAAIASADKKRRALTRNTKHRLSELSHSDLIQVFRNKSKWIQT